MRNKNTQNIMTILESSNLNVSVRLNYGNISNIHVCDVKGDFLFKITKVSSGYRFINNAGKSFNFHRLYTFCIFLFSGIKFNGLKFLSEDVKTLYENITGVKYARTSKNST